MSNYIPVSSDLHRHHFWRPPTDRRYVARQSVIHLGKPEVPIAGLTLPLAILPTGDGGYGIVAILGIEQNENLYVAADGKWIGRYEPTVLRGYPFAMLPTQDGELVLCVDSESELITTVPNGHPIFDAENKPTAETSAIIQGLARSYHERLATRAVCAQLSGLGLIKPWPITLTTNHGERRIEGLFHVDETALNALDDEQFLSLRRSGALLLAYCQLLSTHNLNILVQLANHRPAPPSPLTAPVMELDFSRFGG